MSHGIIDASAYKAKRYPADLVEYIRRRGRKKVLFGSNYPMLTPAMSLEGFDALGLDDGARRLFLYEKRPAGLRLGLKTSEDR